MPAKNGQFTIFGYPFFIFSVFFLIQWTTYWMISYWFTIFPKIFSWISQISDKISESAKDQILLYTNYLHHLRTYLSLVFVFLVNI